MGVLSGLLGFPLDIPPSPEPDSPAARPQYFKLEMENHLDWANDTHVLLFWVWVCGLTALALVKVLLWP